MRVSKRLVSKLDGGSSGDSFREATRSRPTTAAAANSIRERSAETAGYVATSPTTTAARTRSGEAPHPVKDGGGSSSDSFPGDKIEARYRGREKYYPGKIDRDGATAPTTLPTTTRSARRALRAASSAPRSRRPLVGEKFYLGDKGDVEGGKYYPGKVGGPRRRHHDIDYDDGEKETRVEGRLLRRRRRLARRGRGRRAPLFPRTFKAVAVEAVALAPKAVALAVA